MLNDLWAFVTGDVTVSGLIGTRMYLGKLPQSPTLPAISYSIISEVRGHVMTGPDGVPGTRVQIDCWGLTGGSAVAVSNAVLSRLDGYSGLLNGSPSTEVQGIFADQQRTMYENDPELHRISRDYIVYFEE